LADVIMAVVCRELDGKVTMRDFAGYLLIGCLAAMATSAIAVAGFDLAVGARPVTEPGTVIQHVDRSQKGDRLDLPTRLGAQPLAHKWPAVPFGCDRVFSSLSSAPANPLGRCLT
jgi:hypothetical protein